MEADRNRGLNKPLYTLSPDHHLSQTYKRIGVGARVRVSDRWASPDSTNPQAGLRGRVVGFEVGLQGALNVDYLIVKFTDRKEQIHEAWLYTLDVTQRARTLRAS